jgi:hypothetical protein
MSWVGAQLNGTVLAQYSLDPWFHPRQGVMQPFSASFSSSINKNSKRTKFIDHQVARNKSFYCCICGAKTLRVVFHIDLCTSLALLRCGDIIPILCPNQTFNLPWSLHVPRLSQLEWYTLPGVASVATPGH